MYNMIAAGFTLCLAILVPTVTQAQYTQKWFLQLSASFIAAGNTDSDAQLELLYSNHGTDYDSLYLIDGATGQVEWRVGFSAINVGSAQLVDIDGDGKMEIIFSTFASGFSTIRCYSAGISVGIQDTPGEGLIPKSIELDQNYPNPFNPSTTIQYSVTEKSKVTLVIYNSLGQKVRTLVDKEQSAGEFTVSWDGKDNSGNQLATGAYFYALKTETEVESKKMLLLK